MAVSSVRSHLWLHCPATTSCDTLPVLIVVRERHRNAYRKNFGPHKGKTAWLIQDSNMKGNMSDMLFLPMLISILATGGKYFPHSSTLEVACSPDAKCMHFSSLPMRSKLVRNGSSSLMLAVSCLFLETCEAAL